MKLKSFLGVKWAVLSGLLLVATGLTLMVSTSPKALAAGESYTLSGGSVNSEIITVSGGDIKGTAILKYSGTKTAYGIAIRILAGKVVYKTGCSFTMSMDTSDLNFTTGTIDGITNSTCSKQITQSYNGQQVAVKGALATSGIVLVTDIYIPSGQTIPSTDTVTVQSSDGATTYATQTVNFDSKGNTQTFQFQNPNNGATQSYDGQVCSQALNECVQFHKEKGVSVTVDFLKVISTCQSGQTMGTDGTCSGGTSTAQTPTCESSGFSLGWILCPIIEGIAKAADTMYDDLIQPLLVTQPLTLNSSDPMFKAWSQFRILGDIFLVIALLVIVFGQAIGGGLIDAYSAKKILPRLLIAAVAINLSIYLVAAAVDITNVVGNGLMGLIETPFKSSGTFTLNLSGSGTSGGLGMTALITGGIWAIASIGPLIGWLFTFLFIPILLTLVAILATVIIRRGAILFLILVSPVAFALYCLPNTEKYFKQWWDLLIKTLMVYPIIAGIFGIANVLSVTVNLSTSNDTGATKYLSQIISLVALVIPLFLIPFSFKLAGGVIGTLHETFTNGRKRMHEAYKGNINDPNSRQNRARDRLTNRNLLHRDRITGGIGDMQKSKNRALRYAGRGLMPISAMAGSGDLEARLAEQNKKAFDKQELKTGYGPDDNMRALFAQKGYKDAAGNHVNDGLWHSTTDPSKVFSDDNVRKARQLYGRGAGQAETQAAINYELGKVGGNKEKYANFLENAPRVLEETGHRGEVNDVLHGIGYKNAGKYLDLKHSKFTKNAKTGKWERSIDDVGLSNDLANGMRAGDFASFSGVAAEAATAGMKGLQAKQAQNQVLNADEMKALDDYEKVGNYMQERFYSNRGGADPGAAVQFNAAGAEGEDPLASGGFGSGASAEADAQWREFAKQARAPKGAGVPTVDPNNRSGPPPAAGGGSPTGGGPTIIVPPRGYTGSQG